MHRHLDFVEMPMLFAKLAPDVEQQVWLDW
jgi:hypothetical protein